MKKRDKRRTKMKVTIRADTIEIEGYVNAVGRDSRTLTDDYGYPFIEQINPGAFGKALSAAERAEKDIKMLLDHDDMHEIGSTASNLELEEDSIGLHARAVISDAETIKAAREKRLTGWSFGFRTLDYRESWAENMMKRIVTELDLVEVSVIDDRMIPAYAGTSIHARATDKEETIYTRAMDDKVEYFEDTVATVATETEQRSLENEPETHENEPESHENDSPQDYSLYRNKISLLKLG
jgi:hypothetical protein